MDTYKDSGGHDDCTKRGSGRVSAAFQRAYPTRRRIASGLFRASPRSSRLLGVRGGRVRFVAVAGDRVLRNHRRLVRDLRAAVR